MTETITETLQFLVVFPLAMHFFLPFSIRFHWAKWMKTNYGVCYVLCHIKMSNHAYNWRPNERQWHRKRAFMWLKRFHTTAFKYNNNGDDDDDDNYNIYTNINVKPSIQSTKFQFMHSSFFFLHKIHSIRLLL